MVPEPLPDDGPGVAFRNATGLQKPHTLAQTSSRKSGSDDASASEAIASVSISGSGSGCLGPALARLSSVSLFSNCLGLRRPFAAFNTFRVCRRCGLKLTHETRRKTRPLARVKNSAMTGRTTRPNVSASQRIRRMSHASSSGRLHPGVIHQAQKAVVGPIFLKREVRRVGLEVGRI